MTYLHYQTSTMPFYKRTYLALVLVAVGTTTSAFANEDKRVKDIAKNLVYDIYQPAFKDFANVASALSQSVESLCETHAVLQLEASRKAFSATVNAFSLIELHRLGPMLTNNRYNKLFYWPDTRNAGERQLRKWLNEANNKSTALLTISQKSVAVQGLPALERLLFDKAAQSELTLSFNENSRCAVASAVAANITELATDINDAWLDSVGIQNRLLHPSKADPLYRNSEEVLRSVMTQLSVGLEFLRVRKLSVLLDETQNLNPTIRKAPFWKSDNTLVNIQGNLMSLEALVVTNGLASTTTLENELAFEFNVALGHVKKLMALEVLTTSQDTFTDEANNLLKALFSGLNALHATISERLATELGVHAGFNSEDGD